MGLKNMFDRLWESPQLYRVYIPPFNSGGLKHTSQDYEPNLIEACGNKIETMVYLSRSVTYFAFPFLIAYVGLNKAPLSAATFLCECAIFCGLILSASKLMTCSGRFSNADYKKFYKVLEKAQESPSTENLEKLQLYDFDFTAWPASFTYPSKNSAVIDELMQSKPSSNEGIFRYPLDLAAYICFHSFGKYLIFPGCIKPLQDLYGVMLQDGRKDLVTKYNGLRTKINILNKMDISTMFLDRRGKGEKDEGLRGDTLVICCEGNAGFYELGIMSGPMGKNYSVLGWNHPGFVGSTGCPDDFHERLAMAGVMDYAINGLGFEPKNIMVLAWSIGGYTGAWAAKHHPEIKGLILDATFDHLLHLALPRMPSFMDAIVRQTIGAHANLNVAELVCSYNGPLTVIRRTQDNIITTEEGVIATNRANNLVVQVLQARFPKLTDSPQLQEHIWKFVSTERKPLLSGDKDLTCHQQLNSYTKEHGTDYPMNIGQGWSHEDKARLLTYITREIFWDVQSGHNDGLPCEYIKTPFSIQ